MLAIERASQEGLDQYRQLYVTKSRNLAVRVESYFRKLQQSTIGLEAQASGRSPTASSQIQETNLLDWDDEDEMSRNLPKRFSDLKQENFPLFVTFHQVSSLAPWISSQLSHMNFLALRAYRERLEWVPSDNISSGHDDIWYVQKWYLGTDQPQGYKKSRWGFTNTWMLFSLIVFFQMQPWSGANSSASSKGMNCQSIAEQDFSTERHMKTLACALIQLLRLRDRGFMTSLSYI